VLATENVRVPVHQIAPPFLARKISVLDDLGDWVYSFVITAQY